MNYDQNIKNRDSHWENVKKYPENYQKLMSSNINWGGHLFLRYDFNFQLKLLMYILGTHTQMGNRK